MVALIRRTALGVVASLALASHVASADVLCRNTKTGDLKVREAECIAGEDVAVREADEAMVAQCVFVGSLHATSGWGNLAASAGISNAKKSVFRQAEKKRATHIIFGTIVGGYSPSVTAKAYRCSPPAEAKKVQF